MDFKYRTVTSGYADGVINAQDVSRASAQGLTLGAYAAAKYPDVDNDAGAIIFQAAASNGIYLKDDASLGIKASTISQALGESETVIHAVGAGAGAGAPIVAGTVAGDSEGVIRRLLFGEVILQLVEENLRGNETDSVNTQFRRMIATKMSIKDGVFIQPMINSDALLDDEYEATPVENTMPPQMVSIDLSETTRTVPGFTIGLEITDRARTRISLDMVSLVIAQHARLRRERRLWTDINKLFAGSPGTPDAAPLPIITAGSLDATIVTPMTLTETAWFKFRYGPNDPYNRNVAIMDVDSYMAVINRTGRAENPCGGFLSSQVAFSDLPTILNMSRIDMPNVILVPVGTLPAGTILTFDSSKAIAEVEDASIAYQAQEYSALRRNTGFRWDWSEMLIRMMGIAPFKVLHLVP